MATAKQVQFSLKAMMMKESNKVLYAEVDSDFADVLLSFLTLPLGTIVRLLIKHYGNEAPILGSLNSLYAGLQKLDSSHFWTEAGKLMLLNPRNSSGTECKRLKLQIDDTPPIQYFVCKNSTCVSMYYNVECLCSNSMNTMTGKNIKVEAQSGDKSVFTKNTSSFLLTEDLQILTNTPSSVFRFLKLNGIQDTNVLEERSVIVGLKEIMELLKGSLVSKTPITDMVLQISSASATPNKIKKFSAPSKFEPDALPKHQTSGNVSSESRKITVKVFVQKSTNRFLFAQSRNDFMDFLFSLLTIPLGSVQFLLGNNTYLGSINNLYKSISNFEIVECMKSEEAVTRLLGPQIPSYYLSCHQIFSLKQQISPIIYMGFGKKCGKLAAATYCPSSYTQANMIDPKGNGSYVKGPATFTVADDLVVSPPSSTSIVCALNQMKIPIHDVEEQEVEIGMEEALSILKASLISSCALSEGLKPFLMKRPKQEK